MKANVLKETIIRILDKFNVAEIKLGLSSQDLILMYHSVEAEESGYRYGVAKERFEEHIDFLMNICELVSLDEMFNNARNRSARVALTFDDAFEDIYTNVYPLLKSKQIPATVFVPTLFMEESGESSKYKDFETVKDHLSWDQMREMAVSRLVKFESHTHSHMDAVSHVSTLKEDVALSIHLLEHHLDRQPQYFAYPFGSRNSRTDNIILSCGFKKLLTIENIYVRGKITEGRIDIYKGNENMAQFKLTVAGITGARIKHYLGLSN